MQPFWWIISLSTNFFILKSDDGNSNYDYQNDAPAPHWDPDFRSDPNLSPENLSYGTSPDHKYHHDKQRDKRDAPLPQDHFSVSNKGVIRKNIVYNPGQPMEFNCDERIPKSYFPLEMGVLWTRAGINEIQFHEIFCLGFF